MKVTTNFIYPEIKSSDRTYGTAVTGPILRENGDWRDYLPANEDQNVRGIESSACYVEAQQACIASILEEQHDIKDSNFASRFNALLSNGTAGGGDPIKGAKSIKYDGLIPEEEMSWKDITSWEDFHSWLGANKDDCLRKGKEFLNNWKLDFKVVSEKDDALATKYLLLREWLKRSPVPISVYAWFQRNGEYYKPEGVRDNHLTLAVFVDGQNRIHVRDTYSPYAKILEANIDFEFAMAWSVKKVINRESDLSRLFRGIILFITDIFR